MHETLVVPVAEIEAGEDDGLEVLLAGEVLVRHVAHQQVHEHHVRGVDEGDVLQRKRKCFRVLVLMAKI